jgi:hypothetical protein
MSNLVWVLAIVGIIFVLIIFFAGIGIMVAPTPATTTTKTTLTPTTTTGYSHTPSETLYGHVDNGGSYRITTTIRDPTTSLYSIRMVGPQNTDFDLYVQKGLDPTSHNYDYKSAGFSPSEQIDIPYPAVGDYHILVTSVGGSGDFVLYITYKYS